ncbi:acetyl-CoA carboxylase biotin carboxyl carrier protein [Candidatus Kryptonium thompsonii]|uniref:Biotin carboxyl carrier protein of acetyl-CoA carboxylase n=2 Tax=Candidatus Kryptonium thompsonii TaxID=1633631 RepID=A0A0N7MPJ2_9BACT|nr:acetyl-CoA carboxylase biotin carboxyl carrier protein [Candidatus Kryptonium thompsoni]CUS77065.1 acetyl-CoA carboxylase biotin carboxyl carrier protein [Candidatus Kryptonium thompsoni]CUS79195.1 acetyl-CoA carboxylase biotin carboxyl carrier protein [Candidatus Kryptonium thompsoni]CUS79455.1 acetyl-CoA carboxylase biotin carboxyl carrier protein [Candidatus Kryptonium thompsoni]CUS80220.1 acetyl-CoA carboxylase biotin carboxyl carrier protein [Candidatus Kryptonium thompsoni]CUS88862.1 
MDLNYIKELIKAVDESGVEEVEIEIEGSRLRISKNRKGETVAQSSTNSFPNFIPIPFPFYPPIGAVQQPMTIPQVQTPETKVEAPKEEKGAGATEVPVVEKGKKYHEIKSPIVGTFYRAPAPDAEPYVKVGDEVFPGTVLCIVEAMKLMNEIESDVHGIVAKILVENAQPVEYGQPLFLIELLD